ncbi:hypothetical protein [Jeongeupia naejangsanensis]|uniref:ATP-grasp domain-containing protein n=1 Tax=Jeongeupia naejangsanensis TaxID=613195 RepID=A0ABS2BJC2_9NEIS|nr:hypothetical protein [Jeongeupia naejangsanensis]MBM3115193.1 hypothetical protein [Jeongeupia naejangsanensis]
MDKSAALLVIDFNLSRRAEVAHIRDYARAHYGQKTVLIRPNPGVAERLLADHVIDLNPLAPGFVHEAMRQLAQLPVDLQAGLVFSDNAVQFGAELLRNLGLRGDCPVLAENAFCKYQYRVKEQACKDMFEAQQTFLPNIQMVNTVESLASFIQANPGGVVIKPTTEGNNRGVILLENPAEADLHAVLKEVSAYVQAGVIVEQMIPFRKEYSYDGIGSADFITEKFNVSGRYPVEFAQLVPADVSTEQADLIRRTGQLANLIVGQSFGPFHNEIRISDDLRQAAVIEANRRPAGMKIWALASQVFGQDLHGLWVDSVVTGKRTNLRLTPKGSAMSIMLAPAQPGYVNNIIRNMDFLFSQLQRQVAKDHPQAVGVLRWMSCEIIAATDQYVHVPARDNSDFVALITVSADWDSGVMKTYLERIQLCWDTVLNEYMNADLTLVA